MEAVVLPIVGLLIIITLMILFYSKKNMKNLETKIYSKLLVLSFAFILIGLLTFVVAKLTNNFMFIEIFQKIYMIFLVLLNYYSICYCLKLFNKQIGLKFIFSPLIVITILSIMFIFIFPLNVIFYDNVLDGNGLSYNIAIIYCAVCFVFFIVLTLYLLFTKQKITKVLPFIILVVLYVIGFVLRSIYPELIFEGLFYSYILLIMYHTIENPDLKLLEEIHKSKGISDNANEEKTMFLYNMTQEIRNTMNDIDDNADMILESSDLDDDKEYAREIKIIASKFNMMTNEMFDVSKLDSAHIKVYNSKYNIKNIFKEIVAMYNNKCKSKNIDFRVNIDHDVPMVLYGDSIGLKEVLTIIMDNSVKYTKEGFIEFSVNTIIKNDICRLIVTIEDSGMGIKSEDINKIKIEDKSLSKANKLITLMNGTMMISSNYGLGTKVKVILDQKIEVNKNEDVVKYEEVYDDIKLLMVDDSDSGIKIIDKLIRGSSIKMDFAINGKECIDKIKSYGKYDVILLDEQLTQISAMELIKKIKNIRNFNIPVILLTKDNSYEYNDEYKKMGFVDYLLKPVKKEELLNKINKYVKRDK